MPYDKKSLARSLWSLEPAEITETLNLASTCGKLFLTGFTGPPWRDFLGINCLRCKVPQTDAIGQSPVKSGLGQGLTGLNN